MSITKYRANSRFGRIEAISCDRESDACVWINGRRKNKKSSYDCYFDTWDEAHDYLMQRAEGHEHRAQVALDRARDKKQKIAALKKPDMDARG